MRDFFVCLRFNVAVMFGNRAKKILRNTDSATLVPVTLFPHIVNEKDIVELHIPKFKNERFGKIFLSKKSKPHFIIELEEPGSRVYQFIDGSKTISEIIQSVQSDGKEPLDQADERIYMFIKQLFNHKYITFKQLQT